MKTNRITLRAVFLGTIVSALFAWYTVITENVVSGRRILTATQIPVLPYLLLIAGVLILNPVLKRLRFIRRLSTPELMIIFIMTMVSSGISTFGMASQLVPAIAGLFNPSWNTAQSRWDRHIQPYVNEAYFVSEPGIRERSRQARAAEDAWREADAALRAARMLDAAQESLRVLEEDAKDDAGQPAAERVQRARQRAIEQERLAAARERWMEYAGDLDLQTVLTTFPQQVEELRADYEARRAALAELEQRAFEKVDQFRRGLPEPLRAVPGILPVGEEHRQVYIARLRRMSAGLRVIGDIEAARHALHDGISNDASDPVRAKLQRAIKRLDPVVEIDELRQTRETLVARRADIDPRLMDIRETIETLRTQRRRADAREFGAIDRHIDRAETETESLEDELEAIAGDLARVIDPQLQLAREMASVRDALSAVKVLRADGADPRTLDAELETVLETIETLNISRRSLLLGDVPWTDWVGPLGRWILLVLIVYTLLMTFNGLIFRQWAYHEKLLYPLAELPLTLCGADDVEQRRIPALYRSGLFWTGVAVSAFVLGWNILATRQIIPGINRIPLVFDWDPYIRGSMFSGLRPRASHEVFFTMIGISFLIPARISKSLWGFHALYMALLLTLVWLGHGVNERSFPTNMTMVLNFRTAIGGGALIAFSAMTLWTCRRYLFCAAFPKTIRDLEPAERKELRISSALFLVSSILLIVLISYGMGAHPLFAIFCYLVIIVITIGLVRVVAEGGLLVFQCYFGPFHIIRSATGMHRSWTSVSLFAPLVVFYYVLFFDLKTFIAPAMANALKIRDRLGLQRLRFHGAVFLGIGAATVTALVTHVILAYQHGANSMHQWFYNAGPRRSLFGSITDMAVGNPVDQSGGLYWMLAGIAVMMALLVLSRRRSWLPHPIGLVMWVNPVMWALWFSIFIGWIFKTFVSRYGDHNTYLRFREFFIGLIVGELIMCLFGVDLNRN